MTSKIQKKLQKERTRRKEVEKKLRIRREFGRAVLKEEREEVRKQRKFEKEQKEFMKWEEAMEEMYSKLSPEIRKQVEHNIEILKALEDEHQRETDEKRKLNEILEAKGCITPESKMEALQQIALEKSKSDAGEELAEGELTKITTVEVDMGGSADCAFSKSL